MQAKLIKYRIFLVGSSMFLGSFCGANAILIKPGELSRARKATHKLNKITKANKIGGRFVVAEYSGGRLGDNLLAVAHALYFAQQYNCRLLLRPFNYSQLLVLEREVPKFTAEWERKLPKRLKLGKQPFSSAELKRQDVLFEIPYFPEALVEHVHAEWPYMLVDWAAPEFLAKLRHLLTPTQPLALVQLPADRISVAVHVRQGGNFDNAALVQTQTAQTAPRAGLYKFPYLGYYVAQLQLVSELLAHAPLYVFIFTDDLAPVGLMQQIAAAVDRSNMLFDCRRSINHDKIHVLEDFFSLQQFDILIRPDSNFSLMAEKLGDYSMVVSPGNFKAGLSVQYGQVTVKKSLTQLKAKYAVN